MSESENTEKRWGVAHVHASFNNTLITVTDLTGAETIVKSSGGAVVKQNRDEASPYAAMQMAESVAEDIKAAGIDGLHVRVRGPGGNVHQLQHANTAHEPSPPSYRGNRQPQYIRMPGRKPHPSRGFRESLEH